MEPHLPKNVSIFPSVVGSASIGHTQSSQSSASTASGVKRKTQSMRVEHIASTESAGSRHITNDILRAAPLHRSLSWLGCYWRHAPADLPESQRLNLFEESQPVASIDYFLSHTWQTPGYSKAACLLLRFGAQYYLSFGFLALGMFLLLQCSAIVEPPIVIKDDVDYSESFDWKGDNEDYFLGTLFSPLLMLVAYALWPMLPSCLQKGCSVFLDVLCINQVDDDLKCEGIYSLGGFVDRSKSMLLLWSKPYLTRKWCVFEMAAFVGLSDGHERTIEFAPMYIELSCLVQFLLVWVICAMIKVLKYLGLDHSIAALLITLCVLPIGAHILRKEMREKHMFLDALRFFDVRESQCRESFDNDFIDAAITSWHGSAGKFNDHVRTKVLSNLQGMQGVTQYPLRYALFASFPIFCLNADTYAGYITASRPVASIFLKSVYSICDCLFLWTSILYFSVFLCEKFRGKENELFIFSCLKSILIVVTLAVCMMFEILVWNMTITSSIPFACLGLAAAYSMLGAWLWCPSSFKALKISPRNTEITEESIIVSRNRVQLPKVERISPVLAGDRR